MKIFHPRLWQVALVVVGAWGVMGMGQAARAQSMSQAGAGAQAFFGSQGTVYTASDPTGYTWTPPGTTGPYPSGVVLPGLPAAPVAMVYPASPPPNNFQTSPMVSPFNDFYGGGATTATSVIADSYLPSPSVVSDASIAIPFWNITQNPGAPLYAYEQVNFVADYIVTGGTLGGATPALPVFINGTVNPGGFAQFDGTVTYTWQDILADGTLGGVTPLGQLNYSFLTGLSTFSTAILSTGSLAATPTSGGVLELTGYMWVAGDPFSLTVSTVPEPTSVCLLLAGAGGWMIRRRRMPC